MANRDSPGFRPNRRLTSHSRVKRGCPGVDAQYQAKLRWLTAFSARPNWRWPGCVPPNRRHAKLRSKMAAMSSNKFDPGYEPRKIAPRRHAPTIEWHFDGPQIRTLPKLGGLAHDSLRLRRIRPAPSPERPRWRVCHQWRAKPLHPCDAACPKPVFQLPGRFGMRRKPTLRKPAVDSPTVARLRLWRVARPT